MDYAIQLLLPIIGGLMLGIWLTRSFGVNPIWTVILAVLGMVGGIGILYKRVAHPELYPSKKPSSHKPGKPSTDSPHQPAEPKALHLHELEFLYKEPPNEEHPDDDRDDEDHWK